MTNILITGASGFIGNHLLQRLAENKKYRIILLSSSVVEGYTCVLHKNYSFVQSDFEAAGIRQIDCLLHLGAFIPKSSTDANDIKNCSLNIKNTTHLLSNIPMPLKKIIYISSIDIYGHQKEIIDEDTIPNPQTLYASSKLYCEKMIRQFSVENNISYQILRLGHIYGSGEEKYKKFIPVAIRMIRVGHPIIIFTDGQEKRAFLHVDDCCTFIIRALERQEKYGIYNLTSGYSLTIKEIAELLVSLSDKKVKIIIQNNILDTVDYEFDITKRKRHLGEEEVSIGEGLREEYLKFKL